MKIFRHVAYVFVICVLVLGLPFMFSANMGAGYWHSVLVLVVIALYVSDGWVWKRSKKRVVKKEKMPDVDTSSDDQYR